MGICISLVFLTGLAFQTLSAQQRIVVKPENTKEALINPSMGWVFHHYDNRIAKKSSPFPTRITAYGIHLEPSDIVEDFPGASTIYLRLAWSFLEPEEGEFNWSIVDIPTQRWVEKGRKVAFRFTCAEIDSTQPYATPEWVRLAGAKGHFYHNRKIVERRRELGTRLQRSRFPVKTGEFPEGGRPEI